MHILPVIDPVALSLGPLKIHWYALSYILGFVLFIILGRRRIKQGLTKITQSQLDDLLFCGVLGVILGGRLGYVFFYKSSEYLSNPVSIFKVWEGGMSFHGGLIGVILALLYFAKSRDYKFAQVSDFVAPLVPLGLASGRIGNFINGELWGRVTDPNAWWAVAFPQSRYADSKLVDLLPDNLGAVYQQYGLLPRHASQLYEFFLEGIVLFIILWVYSSKPRPMGQVSALFLAGYGIFRFIVEYSRQPDEHLGLLTAGLSMGQWLSLPMILIGLIWFLMARNKPTSVQ